WARARSSRSRLGRGSSGKARPQGRRRNASARGRRREGRRVSWRAPEADAQAREDGPAFARREHVEARRGARVGENVDGAEIGGGPAVQARRADGAALGAQEKALVNG